MSDEHFTVDGTLIEAAASLKSFRPKDKPPSDPPPDDPGNPTVNFHGERRSNATHQSTTDPEARLAKKGKGKEAHLAFMGTRRHIRAALAAAATRDEIVFVLKCASVMSLHSCSLGAPILLEEATAAGVEPRVGTDPAATTGLRQDESDGPMEYGLGSFLRA